MPRISPRQLQCDRRMSLLTIRNLTVNFATRSGAFTAVEGFNLSVSRDEVVAIVGESGSGKSVAMLAVMGLLPWTAKVSADELRFGEHDLLSIGARERRNRSRIWAWMVTSSAVVGSSAISSFGLQASAMAIITR